MEKYREYPRKDELLQIVGTTPADNPEKREKPSKPVGGAAGQKLDRTLRSLGTTGSEQITGGKMDCSL